MKTRISAAVVLMAAMASPGAHAAPQVDVSAAKGLTLRWSEDLHMRLGTRLHADHVAFDDDVTPLPDDTGWRRARVASRIDFRNWRLRADYDAGVSEGWKNLFIEYRGLERQRITAGNHMAPFSMEDTDGSSHMPLMERSTASALNPGMLTGISYRAWGNRWSIAGGVFENALNDLDRRQADGTSVVARGTFAPVRRSGAILHLGVSAEQRRVDDDLWVRLRARPFSRLAERRLVDTGRIRNADGLTNLGLELGASRSNMRLQAEAYRASVDAPGGAIDFAGHYVLASVNLGASAYRYSRSRGVFRGPRTRAAWGALELSARYSRLDLEDRTVAGGAQVEKTLGASWTYNDNLRLMLNVSEIEATPTRRGVEESVTVTALRVQLKI